LSKTSQAKITKALLLFFAVLFAAILIHPEWDLPEVHDVKITSTRHQSHIPAERPIQPASISIHRPLTDLARSVEWLPQPGFAAVPSGNEPLLIVLRV
jgi:hypothetical protein